VIICFVDISGIVDHYCLNFLFSTRFYLCSYCKIGSGFLIMGNYWPFRNLKILRSNKS